MKRRVTRRRLRQWGERPFGCVYLAGQICRACIYKITRDLKDKERAVDGAFVSTGWFARRRRQTRAQKQSGTTRVTDVAVQPKREIIFSAIATRETRGFSTISARTVCSAVEVKMTGEDDVDGRAKPRVVDRLLCATQCIIQNRFFFYKKAYKYYLPPPSITISVSVCPSISLSVV